MPSIVHFDISAENTERVQAFYETLFGWKITDAPGPIPYKFIETADAEGNPGVGGGIAQRSEGEEGGITNFIGVDSVDDYLLKVKAAGGTVVQGKMPVPGFGYLAVCLDTEGNRFGLWETNETAQH